MNRFIRLAIIPGVLLFAAASSSAQDASKIIDQYLHSAGGPKALKRVKTLTLEGTITGDSAGTSGTYTRITKLPNRLYSELILSETHLIEAYNGKSAWRESASGEIDTLLGPEAIQMEAAAQVANTRLMDLKKNKLTAAYVGHAQVRGKEALQIALTSATGVTRQLFFDPQTHLLVKEAAPAGGVEEEILYDDYRAENGVQLPHRLELHRGAESYAVTVTRIAVNGVAGERVFDFPRKSQVQLPDLKALFKEIDENQKALDKLKEKYAGTRTEEETEFEGNGKVKKRETKEYTFFYLDGDEMSTLVKKDGKPLNEEEQKKENEHVRKRIQEHQKNEAKKEAKEEKAKQEGKDKNNDDVGIEVFLRASQFVNPRRERFRGQDVLVFDFEPNPEFKAHKLEEKLVQKLAGVVWVDEKAHDVARLEAYFVGDMKIGGGLLANLQKGTSFVFEQSFLNNEVWLPTYAEIHLGVRVLLVKAFKVNEVIRYSDYKKFNIESLATISAPKQ
jgi:hypothetical protein